jgi:hypothetical protein
MDRIANKLVLGRLLAFAAITGMVDQIDGQSPPDALSAAPAFEVASIKPLARPYTSGGKPWTAASHGRFIAPAVSLRIVIGWAYNVLPPGAIPAVKVHGGPTWIDTDPYDFEAKVQDPNAGPDQIRAMIQTLLIENVDLTCAPCRVTLRDDKEFPPQGTETAFRAG